MRSTTANTETKERHERGQAIPAADIVSHCNFCRAEQSYITVIYFHFEKSDEMMHPKLTKSKELIRCSALSINTLQILLSNIQTLLKVLSTVQHNSKSTSFMHTPFSYLKMSTYYQAEVAGSAWRIASQSGGDSYIVKRMSSTSKSSGKEKQCHSPYVCVMQWPWKQE